LKKVADGKRGGTPIVIAVKGGAGGSRTCNAKF